MPSSTSSSRLPDMALAAIAGRVLPPLPPPRNHAPGSRSAPSVGLNAVITAREDLTDTVACFRVRPDDPLPPIRPGQYLALGLILNGRVLQRPYSTATAAGVSDERKDNGGRENRQLFPKAILSEVRVQRRQHRYRHE